MLLCLVCGQAGARAQSRGDSAPRGNPELLQRHWTARWIIVPDAPPAGYTEDGRRWLSEVEPYLGGAGHARGELERTR